MRRREKRSGKRAPTDPSDAAVGVRWVLLGVAVLAVATGIVYRGVLENDFVSMDDDIYIYQNTHIRSFSAAGIYWMLTNTSVSYWHPVAWLAHALDYGLFGLRPGMHHATSVVLHILSAALALLLFVLVLERARC